LPQAKFTNTTRVLNNNVCEVPLFPASLLLSSKPISWTLLGGFGVLFDSRFPHSVTTTSPIGSRVYYCIEERAFNARALNRNGKVAKTNNVNVNSGSQGADSMLPPPTPPNNNDATTTTTNNTKSHKTKTADVAFNTKSSLVMHNFISSLYDSNISSEVMAAYKGKFEDEKTQLMSVYKTVNKHHKIGSQSPNSESPVKDLDSILSYPDILETRYKSSSGHTVRLHFAPGEYVIRATRVIRLFFGFFEVWACGWWFGLPCFGPSLNNTFAQKDAPGQTIHRVQF